MVHRLDAVGLPGLRGTDGLSQIRFYYAVDESPYELLYQTRGQLNANGLLSTPPKVRVKTLADDSVSDLSDSWDMNCLIKQLENFVYPCRLRKT